MSDVINIEDLGDLLKQGKHNKYGVAPSAERRWRGRVWASKTEMRYAQQLAVDPDVAWWVAQPIVTGWCRARSTGRRW